MSDTEAPQRLRVENEKLKAQLDEARSEAREALERSKTERDAVFTAERERTLVALRESEQALRRSEARFRALVENSADAIKLIDDTGRIRYVTPSTERVLGYPAESFVGKSVFDFVHTEDRAELAAALARSLANPRTPVRTELRYRHRDGLWRTLEAVRVNHLDDPDLQAIVVNYRDVTERKLLEAQFAQAQKMEAIGQLAGGIAHDFNNALTAILSLGQFVLEELPPDTPLAGDITEMVRAAGRASSLTRQLLAFGSKQIFQPTVVDLNGVVEHVRGMLHRLIGEHIEFTITLEPTLLSVRVDPRQVEQILTNLVVNARDAIRDRAGCIRIETRNVHVTSENAGAHPAVAPGAYVQLSVIDDGIGMDENVRARIFEPFFTTKAQGQGTGLGLPTVFGIVKQSGGHIFVDSESGHGSTFRICIPATNEAPTASIEAPVTKSGGTETILLVEDEPAVRQVAMRTLRRAGYSVIEAENGAEAAGMVEREGGATIDLLITDVVMPRVSGPELAARLRAIRPTLSVLFISGHTESAVIRNGIVEGTTNFLEKPFSPHALLMRVRGILDHQQPSSRAT